MSETTTTTATTISQIEDLNGNTLEIADAAARDAIENLPVFSAITDEQIQALFTAQGGNS